MSEDVDTEFTFGDIVRITRGEPGTPGYEEMVREVVRLSRRNSEIELFLVQVFAKESWNVELIERPAPPLPTDPNTLGWATYLGKRRIVRRDAYGLWDIYDSGGEDSVAADSDLSDFTEAVLIPKELADEVTAWADDEDGDWAEWYSDTLLQKIADHLKGQDDE
ncbi:hypothetical protein [Brevibacterium gallinarum]|uniref:Uncharacterized protein n=1 Tax=Brevibacterium gallinarum TaxID=2762220 RepID=A0ABR8WQU5_9MICO|nr:hypothetical protein [Brevibacterium gallinarum]MBD8019365.1 hypothetical protein [Brevibacterium gallinarum]